MILASSLACCNSVPFSFPPFLLLNGKRSEHFQCVSPESIVSIDCIFSFCTPDPTRLTESRKSRNMCSVFFGISHWKRSPQKLEAVKSFFSECVLCRVLWVYMLVCWLCTHILQLFVFLAFTCDFLNLQIAKYSF